MLTPETAASSSKLGWGCSVCDGQSSGKLHPKSSTASSGGCGGFTPSLCQINAAADQPTMELPSILVSVENGKMYFKKMQVCKGTARFLPHEQEGEAGTEKEHLPQATAPRRTHFFPSFQLEFSGSSICKIWGSSSLRDLGTTAPSAAGSNETSELSFSNKRCQGKCLWEKKKAGLGIPNLTQRLLLVSDSWDRECAIPRQCHPSPGTIVLLIPKGICLARPCRCWQERESGAVPTCQGTAT